MRTRHSRSSVHHLRRVQSVVTRCANGLASKGHSGHAHVTPRARARYLSLLGAGHLPQLPTSDRPGGDSIPGGSNSPSNASSSARCAHATRRARSPVLPDPPRLRSSLFGSIPKGPLTVCARIVRRPFGDERNRRRHPPANKRVPFVRGCAPVCTGPRHDTGRVHRCANGRLYRGYALHAGHGGSFVFAGRPSGRLPDPGSKTVSNADQREGTKVTPCPSTRLSKRWDAVDQTHDEFVRHVVLYVMPAMRLRTNHERYFRDREKLCIVTFVRHTGS